MRMDESREAAQLLARMRQDSQGFPQYLNTPSRLRDPRALNLLANLCEPLK